MGKIPLSQRAHLKDVAALISPAATFTSTAIIRQVGFNKPWTSDTGLLSSVARF
jgi:hypothetical protein